MSNLKRALATILFATLCSISAVADDSTGTLDPDSAAWQCANDCNWEGVGGNPDFSMTACIAGCGYMEDRKGDSGSGGDVSACKAECAFEQNDELTWCEFGCNAWPDVWPPQ